MVVFLVVFLAVFLGAVFLATVFLGAAFFLGAGFFATFKAGGVLGADGFPCPPDAGLLSSFLIKPK